MMNFMIESVSWVLLPIAFVSVVLVGLVLLFARDRALMVFRNLYLYGILVTTLLISVVTAILLFNTLLNTVVFPTQSDSGYLYSRPLDNLYGVTYDTGVEDFLKQKQTVIDERVDAISFTQNWRDQLSWSIPLLLVCLPIFLLYRRKIIKPMASEVGTETSTSTIRYAYLFTTAYLSLIAVVIGGVGVINVVLEQYILPPHYDTYTLRNVLNDQVQGKYTFVNMTVAQERAAQAMTNLDDKIQKAKTDTYPTNERNRALSLSFSFLVIGGAIYWWHRKDVMMLIQTA